MTAPEQRHVWPPAAVAAPQQNPTWPLGTVAAPPTARRSFALPLAFGGAGAALVLWAVFAWQASRAEEDQVEETTRRRLGHTGRVIVPSAGDIHVAQVPA